MLERQDEKINKLKMDQKALSATITALTYAKASRILPIKTGNLNFRAFKYQPTERGIRVFISAADAPYIAYPNVQRKLGVAWPRVVQVFEFAFFQAMSGKL